MIIRPQPFPDELDRGYLGRVMHRNGKDSQKDIEKLICIWLGEPQTKTRRQLPLVELLSKVAGLELAKFVRQHTTLPLRRSISSYQTDLAHGSELNRSLLSNSGMRMARPGAYFCKECVNEDQDFHKESYWRRTHQIPGQLCCYKHGISLNYVSNEDAFLLPPSKYLDQCQSIDPIWVDEVKQNIYIQKYLEISSGLMDSTMPIDVKNIVSAMCTQASLCGYQTSRKDVNDARLSDAVVAAFGRKWLATLIPRLAIKVEGEPLSQMDGVLYLKKAASSYVVYVLASALLFDSADAALNALNALNPLITSQKSGTKIPHKAVDQAELIEAYIQAKGKHITAAKLLGASQPASLW